MLPVRDNEHINQEMVATWAGKERQHLNSYVTELSVSDSAEVWKTHPLEGFQA